MKLASLTTCLNPKHIGQTAWQILQKNVISQRTYLALVGLELLEMVFYSLLLVARIHFQNFGNNNQTEQGHGISLSFMRDLDNQLQTLVAQNDGLLFALTVTILIVVATIVAAFLLKAALLTNMRKKKNEQDAEQEKSQTVDTMLCIFFVATKTFLHLPLYDIVLRTLQTATADDTLDSSTKVLRIIVCAGTLIILSLVMFFIFRIFHLSVPSELLPWCAPYSKLTFLTLLIQALSVVSVTMDPNGHLVIYEISALLLALCFQSVYRIMFVPQYNAEVDFLFKSKDFMLTLIYFIGVMCRVLSDQYDLDLVYFIIFCPVVSVAWTTADNLRRTYIIEKLKQNGANFDLQLQEENEYALHTLAKLLEDSLGEDAHSNKEFGLLLSMLFSHIEECTDPACICNEMENYNALLQLRQQHTQDDFSLHLDERIRFKRLLDNQSMIETCSSFSDMTQKVKSNALAPMPSQQFVKQKGITFQDELEEVSAPSQDFEFTPDLKESPSKIVEAPRVTYQTYNVNIIEMKQRFLAELVYLFFYKILSKFPENMQLQLFANYFTLKFRSKELLTIFQLRNFQKSKLSSVDMACYTINEQYLLWEINRKEKNDYFQKVVFASGANKDKLDGDYFITVNQLQHAFSKNVEKLGQSVMNFWRNMQRQELLVFSSLEELSGIAETTRKVFRVFKELDDLKLFKDYQNYFQIALVQLHILNDPNGYELYIGKMKSILEINLVYQKNFAKSSSHSTENANFIIVDANGANFGKILLYNTIMRQALGYSDDEMKTLTIENLMPWPIYQKHGLFIKKFNHTGQSFIINNKATQFVKKKSGFVTPTEMFIKFHHSIEYQFTFLAIMKPFTEMTPFSSGISYTMDQLLFMIVEDDMEGSISEYSDSSSRILREMGVRLNSEDTNVSQRLTDVLPDFDFRQLKNTRQDRLFSKEIYEGEHSFDLSCFQSITNLGQKQVQFSRKDSLDSQEFGNGGMGRNVARAKVRVFEERYSGGILDLNIVCLAFVTDEAIEEEIANVKSAAHMPEKRVKLLVSKHVVEEDLKNKDESDMGSGSASGSGTGSSGGSANTTEMIVQEFKSFGSFERDGTPRMLQIIMRLIVALYLIMMAVASLNLGLNIQKQNQAQQDIHTLKDNFDRLNQISINIVIFRSLAMIANGYTPNHSNIMQDRFSDYKAIQLQGITRSQVTQALIQQSPFVRSDILSSYENSINTVIDELSSSNRVYNETEYVNVAFSSYINKAITANSYTLDQFQSNLALVKIGGFEDGQNYSPSSNEQTLYFALQNGLLPLRAAALDSCYLYARDAQDHTNSSVSTALLTSVLSIVSIVAIGLVLSPLLTRAETRRIMAIKYFLTIPRTYLVLMVDNIERYCMHFRDEKVYNKVQREYESILGLRIINQQIEQVQNFEADADITGTEAISDSNFVTGGFNSSAFHSNSLKHSHYSGLASRLNDDIDGVEEKDERSYVKFQSKLAPINEEESSNSGVIIAHSPEKPRNKGAEAKTEYKLMSTIRMGSTSGGGSMDPLPHMNSLEPSTRVGKSFRRGETAFVGQPGTNDIIDSYEKESNPESMRDKQETPRDMKNRNKNEIMEVEDVQENQEEEQVPAFININSKLSMIQQFILRRQTALILTTVSAVAILSTYFVISYVLSINTYNTAGESINSLEMVFMKGACFDFSNSFLRASQINNASMLVKNVASSKFETNDDNYYPAANYYMNYCLEKEADFLKMRVNPPSYFQDAMPFLQSLENQQICDTVFATDPDLMQYHDLCKTAMNGIFQEGLSNAYTYMYSLLQRAEMNFDEALTGGYRTAEFLQEQLADPVMIEVVDTKSKMLNPTLDKLNTLCMTSVINYVNLLVNNSLIAYVIFSLIMTGCMLGLLGAFNRVKRSMTNTDIVIRIIPFHTLSAAQVREMKQVFSQ